MSSLQKFNWEAVLVEEFIRKGSFCYVTKATLFSHKKAHGRPVAIKYITEDICLANNVDFDRTVNLLREEAEKISLAKRNNARNVVSIYGTVEGILPQETAKVLPSAKENQRAFGILLKYEGISLHEYLHRKENKNISLVKKLEILRDLCCAIMDLHDLDLVDGDIKPSNVVVSGNDPVRVRVIDFGVSNYVEGRSEEIFAHSALTITDHYVGSLPYCAPGKSSHPIPSTSPSPSAPLLLAEIIESRARPTRASDIFSFAITCREVLTMKPSIYPAPLLTAEDFPSNTPLSVVEMIRACCSSTRSDRLSSMECFSILSNAVEVLKGGSFDIFFSHTWLNKPFLRHVHNHLTSLGFRVFYDETELHELEMRNQLVLSIKKSNVMLFCLNQHFFSRENCLYEFQCAHFEGKPMVAIMLEKDFSLAALPPETIKRIPPELRVMLSNHLENIKFVDLSELASLPVWTDVNADKTKAIEDLGKKLGELEKILETSRIFPRFAKNVLKSRQLSLTPTPLLLDGSSSPIPPRAAEAKEDGKTSIVSAAREVKEVVPEEKEDEVEGVLAIEPVLVAPEPIRSKSANHPILNALSSLPSVDLADLPVLPAPIIGPSSTSLQIPLPPPPPEDVPAPAPAPPVRLSSPPIAPPTPPPLAESPEDFIRDLEDWGAYFHLSGEILLRFENLGYMNLLDIGELFANDYPKLKTLFSRFRFKDPQLHKNFCRALVFAKDRYQSRRIDHSAHL